jgi:hypothetical protein
MADNTDAGKLGGWKLFALSALFWLPTLAGVTSRAIKAIGAAVWMVTSGQRKISAIWRALLAPAPSTPQR